MQPFQETVVAAGPEGAASPWALLQKTYSNLEEHAPSETDGQLQQSSAETAAASEEAQRVSAMGMIDQVSIGSCLHSYGFSYGLPFGMLAFIVIALVCTSQ